MDEKKKIFLENLSQSLGIVKAACDKSGIARKTFYDWRRNDPEFAEAAAEITEVQKDYVESNLLKLIKDGDTTATIFYLKTKARDRGYGGASEPKKREPEPQQEEKSQDKQLEQRVTAKVLYIEQLLQEQSKYTPELSVQVKIAAQLLVKVDDLSAQMAASNYDPFKVEYSREGNARTSVNPVERLFLEYTQQAQKALRSLGMNTDSKERKSEGESETVKLLEALKDEDGD